MEHVSAERTNVTMASGSALETLAGVGGIVLAILGLARIAPMMMAAIATIVVAGAMLIEGGVFAGRAAVKAGAAAVPSRAVVRKQLAGAGSAEVIGGIGGVVLGILTLIGAADLVLLAAAVIVFGGALLVSGMGAPAAMRMIERDTADPSAEHSFDLAAEGATGAQVLVGLAAVTLGILSLLGIEPLALVLVALISVGATMLLNGAAVGAAAGYAARR